MAEHSGIVEDMAGGRHQPDLCHDQLTAGLVELRRRVGAIELEHLQLRTKYLQTQVQLMRYEHGGDQAWSELDDPDVQVISDQIDSLRDRIEGFDQSSADAHDTRTGT